MTQEPKGATWECFSDVAYYDMWCVRRVGDRTFGQGFHLVRQDEAQALCDYLNGGLIVPEPDPIKECAKAIAYNARSGVRGFKEVVEEGDYDYRLALAALKRGMELAERPLTRKMVRDALAAIGPFPDKWLIDRLHAALTEQVQS